MRELMALIVVAAVPVLVAGPAGAFECEAVSEISYVGGEAHVLAHDAQAPRRFTYGLISNLYIPHDATGAMDTARKVSYALKAHREVRPPHITRNRQPGEVWTDDYVAVAEDGATLHFQTGSNGTFYAHLRADGTLETGACTW